MILPADVENKSQNNNRVIVVLGMHRSGTSALTRSLQVLGIGLGDNLHPAGLDNPKGFWEDQDCIAINEELLSHLGSEYDRLGLDWEVISTDSSISHLYAKATRLVSESVAKNQGVWGVKDPRMCRLLGFWKKVFDICSCSVNYVIAIRNPISIAESLENRNHLPPEKSYFLWLQHMVPAILGSRDEDRVVVNYDLLLDAPEEQIARIASHLKIPFDMKNNALLMDFSKNFLDNNLRHSTYSLAQISLDSHLPYDALKAYELLLRVARDEISINSNEVQSGFEQIQTNLQTYASIFTYTNLFEERELNNLLSFGTAYVPEIYPELRKRWVSYLITVPELEVERLGFYRVVNRRDEQITDLTQNVTTGKVQLIATLVESNGKIVNLQEAVVERDEQIASLNQVVVERDEQIANLNQVMVARNEQIIEYEKQVFHLTQITQTVVERDEQIANLTTQLNEIHQSKAWYFIQTYRKIRSRIIRL